MVQGKKYPLALKFAIAHIVLVLLAFLFPVHCRWLLYGFDVVPVAYLYIVGEAPVFLTLTIYGTIFWVGIGMWSDLDYADVAKSKNTSTLVSIRICPYCQQKNNPELNNCYKCASDISGSEIESFPKKIDFWDKIYKLSDLIYFGSRRGILIIIFYSSLAFAALFFVLSFAK